MSYRERIHAQQYLAEQREEFPADPWRYVETALAKGLTFADLNRAELEWFVTEQQRILNMMKTWTGLVPYTPEQIAAIEARINAATQAQG